ncbi:hypothetical protein [Macrococcoides caseolyticum]|nr:hypothetical protein [Macrococcus caseolyticus]
MREIKEVTNMIVKCLSGVILVEVATGKEYDLFDLFEKENDE